MSKVKESSSVCGRYLWDAEWLDFYCIAPVVAAVVGKFVFKDYHHLVAVTLLMEKEIFGRGYYFSGSEDVISVI